MDAKHKIVEDKYAKYRQAVYYALMQSFPTIDASEITYNYCIDADKWKDLPREGAKKVADWSWREEYARYRNKPNRFELALSANGVLGALCYGQTSVTNSKTRLDLIESIPVKPTPLGQKALPIIVRAGAMFAELVGATELWVIDPDPDIEGLYQKAGFSERRVYHEENGKPPRIGQEMKL